MLHCPPKLVFAGGGAAELFVQVRGPRGEVTPLLLPSLVLLRRRMSRRGISGYKWRVYDDGEAQATRGATTVDGGTWKLGEDVRGAGPSC